MTSLIRSAVVCLALAFVGANVTAAAPTQARLARMVLANGDIALPGVLLSPPAGWRLRQDAINGDTLILGFANGDDYVTFYVKGETGLSMRKIFMNDVKQEAYVPEEKHHGLTWQHLLTSKTTELSSGRTKLYMDSFQMQLGRYTYFGYARSESKGAATTAAAAFLDGMRSRESSSREGRLGMESLTAPDYTGKKYYIGFGDALSGFMGNEVKYDIAHTHDIFTEKVGGDYEGVTLLGKGHRAIVNEWATIRNNMTGNDMYVQYSSGHGSHSGLMAGVSYQEIRDNALAMPAREIIIFTMACYSGNLVSSFNQKRDLWQDWADQGRTLMVMSSSQPDEPSETGPGTDSDEPNAPYGSAGSAFGHALWKALIGYSDGYVDGVKDGFVSLGEIREYTAAWVRQYSSGAQNPAVTGTFNPGLIMNRVPSAEYLRTLVGTSTEGMSDAEVETLIQKLDREMAVSPAAH